MLEWLKSVWANWKITVTVVGGAIVVATAYGTCVYEPASDEVSVAPAPAVETAPASSTDNADTTATTTEDASGDVENTGNTENIENTNTTTE